METDQAAAGGDGDEHHLCRRNSVKYGRCKNVSGDNSYGFCDFHYIILTDFLTNGTSFINSKKIQPPTNKKYKKKKEIQNKKTEMAKKRKDMEKKKKKEMEMVEKKNLPPDEQRCRHTSGKAWRCKNFRMGHGHDDDHSVPEGRYCDKNYNYYFNYRKNHKRRSGDGGGAGSSAATGPIQETRVSKRRKKVSEEEEDEIQPPTSDTIVAGGSPNIGSGELESLTGGIRESVVELENLEHYKNKCFEKFKVKFKVKFVEVEETRKTAAKVEPEEWNKCSDLESPTLRVENENSTKTCVNSNLESLVLRNGKKSSTIRGVELRNFEKIESEAWGLQNEVTQEGEGWGCSEGRLSQHGLSSQDHLEMCTKAFVNLVSDDSGECLDESEDSDSSGSPGTLTDMMAMKYRNRSEDKEMKWKFEADMLSSLEEEPDLCMKAVCALYQQHISKDEMSANGLFHYSDVHRCTTLAKFLLDGACKGELKKSVKELEIFDSKGAEDCKRLATSYSKQLFSIYQRRKDPCFLPATTASHGDQTAK